MKLRTAPVTKRQKTVVRCSLHPKSAQFLFAVYSILNTQLPVIATQATQSAQKLLNLAAERSSSSRQQLEVGGAL